MLPFDLAHLTSIVAQVTRERSPEFDLLLAALRWPLAEAQSAKIRQCLSQKLDWSLFRRGLRRHRVTPLVWRNLRLAAPTAIPAAVEDIIHARVHKLAERTLLQIGALGALTQAFAAAGINALSLKGPALAATLFGDPLMRENKDIDLLIDPAALRDAENILARSGYRRIEPDFPLKEHEERIYRRYFHHYGFIHPATTLQVELHWRLTSDPELMPSDMTDLWSRREEVELGGKPIAVLSQAETLLYLAIHGSGHAWFRAKWLADIGRLLDIQEFETTQDLPPVTAPRTLLPMLKGARQLAKEFLGRPLPPTPAESSWRATATLPIARWALTADGFDGDRTRTPLFHLATLLYEQGQVGSVRSLGQMIVRESLHPPDWRRIPLPHALFPAYFAIRPISWAVRKAMKGLSALKVRRRRPDRGGSE